MVRLWRRSGTVRWEGGQAVHDQSEDSIPLASYDHNNLTSGSNKTWKLAHIPDESPPVHFEDSSRPWAWVGLALGTASQRGTDHKGKQLRVRSKARKGTVICLGIVTSILIVNVILAIWAVAAHNTADGTVVLYTGTCSYVRTANTWLHLTINILASALVGASTYVMQCLTAPTRQDLDRAHAVKNNLWIGSMSMSNLQWIRARRVKIALFAILWASSAPIHLMYNSVFVASVTNAEWASYVVHSTDMALQHAVADISLPAAPKRNATGYSGYVPWENSTMELMKWLMEETPPMGKIDTASCIQTYMYDNSFTGGDVITISNPRDVTGQTTLSISPNSTVLVSAPQAFALTDEVGFSISLNGTSISQWSPWVACTGATDDGLSFCTPGKGAGSVAPDPKDWIMNGVKVEYCLSRTFPPLCELNMSLEVMLIVLACNVCKLFAMAIALYYFTDRLLLTIGDGIASYLESPDATTKNLCIYSSEYPRTYSSWKLEERKRLPTKWHLERTSINTASNNHWIFTLILNLVFVCGTSWGLYKALDVVKRSYWDSEEKYSFSSIWSLGIGNEPPIEPNLSVSTFNQYPGSWSHQALIDGAVLANLPQLGLSVLSFMYDKTLTNIFLVREWLSYGRKRQGLRTTTPITGSAQHSTYFLHFPLNISITTLTIFAILHWLLAESFFLKRTYALYPSGTPGDPAQRLIVSRLAFSPLALFWLTIGLALLLVLFSAFGFLHLDCSMPLVAGQSLGISGACHPPPEDRHPHLAQVQWGVTGEETEDGVGHCTFTSLTVQQPVEGRLYA